MSSSKYPPERSAEDSGLINLDALMSNGDSKAAQPEIAAAVEPAAVEPVVAPAVATPAAPSEPVFASGTFATGSADAIAEPDVAKTDVVSATELAAPSSRAAQVVAATSEGGDGREAAATSGDSLQATVGAPERPKRRRRLVLAFAVILLVTSGAGIVKLRSANVPSAPIATAPTPEQHKVAVVAPVTTNAEPETNANALPVAPEESAAASASAPAHAARAATTVASPPVPAASASAHAEISTVDLASAGGDAGDLAGAMRSAVGPKTEGPAATNDTTNPNARQIRPPPGQVVGAISAVLPSARACLGPDDPVRTGTIVFASDGSVGHVNLQGEKCTDACVRTALSKARVQPFADESFTTHITVRP
jgi:hypothetical protein